MNNPVLVEVTRGGRVESRHRGALAVVDAEGRLVFSLGDIETPVFPRSAIKALQTLALIESGAADRFKLSESEIALACSSHSGEPVHAETAAAMLHKAGRDTSALECGAHWPGNEEAARDLARRGARPTALHNNCSGKHAGFVCLACQLDADPKGYVMPEHRVQKEIRAVIENVAGDALRDDWRGTDGCSIPTYGASLQTWARAFARFGTGRGLGAGRARAAARIRASAARHPHMVGGTGRFDTDVMAALGLRAFTKTGAEGVFCAALPEQGLGIALKCEDGAKRAAQLMMAEALARFLPLNDPDHAALAPWRRKILTNWNGIDVGEIRATAPLALA